MILQDSYLQFLWQRNRKYYFMNGIITSNHYKLLYFPAQSQYNPSLPSFASGVGIFDHSFDRRWPRLKT